MPSRTCSNVPCARGPETDYQSIYPGDSSGSEFSNRSSNRSDARTLFLDGRARLGYSDRVTSVNTSSGSSSDGLAAPGEAKRPAPGHHPKWLAYLLGPINREYGTYRGLIRLWLTQILLKLGCGGPLTRIDARSVRRVVFVCQGNICRSPFAEFAARQAGMRAASFGLATGGSVPAFPLAAETARSFGVDLMPHRARDMADFRLEPGDLVLAMELRHLRRLRSKLAGQPVQVSLLGLWASQPRAHIHDPHRLNAEYFQTCFSVITASLQGLAVRLRDAPVSERPPA